MSNIVWTVLKMVYIDIYRDTQKFSDTLWLIGVEGRFKREAYFNMFILQEM